MDIITKQHTSILSESFTNMSAYERHEAECKIYADKFNEILSVINEKGLLFKGHFESFCPYLQYLHFDALRKEDWPNGIAENSVYLRFSLDLRTNTVQCNGCGHIWLSKSDQKKSYLAMCSMKKAIISDGGKWMRKSRYKDAKDLVNKIERFRVQVIEHIEKVTGGYPYKQMLIDIY